MGSVVVEVELPEEMLELLGGRRAASEAASQGIVLELVRRGEIDPSRAARLLDVPLLDFVQLMASRGIPYYDLTTEEWAAEVERVKADIGATAGRPA